jgi:hypothetical protein
MRTIRGIAIALVALCPAAPARAADETPAKPKIVGVDLFKNGLAVVKCEVTLGKPGTYVLEDVPQPVHGTFHIESSAPVEALVKMRDVEVPVSEATPGNLQEDLAGKKVTLHFRGANRPPVSGTMLKMKREKADETVSLGRGYAYGYANEPPGGRFLVIQTAKGRAYVEASDVASVESEDAGDKVIRKKPRMLLTLGATDKAETRITLRYLTTGMAWAPSYRIDISDRKTLTLEQHAAVRNELADLDGAEIRLISGFPSVEFKHVRSLVSRNTSLAQFFAELGAGVGRDIDALSNSIVGQQAIAHNARAPHNLSLGATPAGEGVDLHYQSIGKRTLADGDTLALTVGKGQAAYERIVEWLVEDHRDEYGRYDRNGRERDNADPWDALKFKNPLPFPMTTGPATVVANGLFNGQRTSYWVNSGEETVVRVEKALSVRTRATEVEQIKGNGDTRDFIWYGGRQYRKVTVEGEVAVSNHRKEDVSMLIRRRFSGDMVKAEGNPTVTLRTEGVYSINKRNELVWALPLKSGEELKLKYSYTVLVLH